MRLKTAVAAFIACFVLAMPSLALGAMSPTEDAYSGLAGQQQGGGNTNSPAPEPVSEAVSSGGETPAATESEATSSSGTLPFTGFEVGVIALVGIALVGGGFLLFRLSRRPEPQGS